MDEPEPSGQTATSRRTVLTGLAGTALAATLPAATLPIANASAAAPALPADFLVASGKLCGLPLDGSYLQLADTLWQILAADDERAYREICAIAAAAPDEAALRRALVDDAKRWPRTRALISLWYTGMQPATAPAAATRVVTYNDALAWTVCQDFTKPPATCGGPFGYWHEPPAA